MPAVTSPGKNSNSSQKNKHHQTATKNVGKSRTLRIEHLEQRLVLSTTDVLPSNSSGEYLLPQLEPLQVDPVFAPGTSASVAAEYDINSLGGFDNFTFSDSDRWTRTATSGGGLAQGAATIVTWSIVPDGTAVAGYDGEPASPSNLRAFLGNIYGTNPNSTLPTNQPWFSVVKQVFDRWSALSGVTYVYEPADDGAALGSTANGAVGVRGDARLSGHFIDGPSNILAYNFFPTISDMVIDT